MATIKELFQSMEISDKERMALEATLRGVDLEELFTSMDNIVDILRPLYQKNAAALGVDYGSGSDKTVVTTGVTGKSPHTVIVDEHIVGNEAWETDPESLRASRNKRCDQCGIILFDNGDLCPECKEDRDHE